MNVEAIWLNIQVVEDYADKIGTNGLAVLFALARYYGQRPRPEEDTWSWIEKNSSLKFKQYLEGLLLLQQSGLIETAAGLDYTISPNLVKYESLSDE